MVASGGFMCLDLVTVAPDLLQENHHWESTKQVCFSVVNYICNFGFWGKIILHQEVPYMWLQKTN